MIKKIVFILLFYSSLNATSVLAQTCYFQNNSSIIDTINKSVNQAEVDKSVLHIMRIFGGFSKNFTMIACKNNNASASVNEGLLRKKRVISYDLNFFSYVINKCGATNAYLPIIAHEIGHHLAGHTEQEIGTKKYAEIEADIFAGFVCRKLGLTEPETIAPFELLAKKDASANYPSAIARKNNVIDGWRKGGEGILTTELINDPNIIYTHTISIPNHHSIYVRSMPFTDANFSILRKGPSTKIIDSINAESKIAIIKNGTPFKLIRDIHSCYEIRFKDKGIIYQGFIAKKLGGKSTIQKSFYNVNKNIIIGVSIAFSLLIIIICSLLYKLHKRKKINNLQSKTQH
jgi:hypothetical protein